MPAPRGYPLELRERSVRMYRAAEPKTVIRRTAEELGVHHEALRNWIRHAEADAGERGDLLTSDEHAEPAALRKESTQLKRSNEILRTASAFSRHSSTRPGPGVRAPHRARTPGGGAPSGNWRSPPPPTTGGATPRRSPANREASAGCEAVEGVGPVLEALDPVAYEGLESVEGNLGDVGQAALDVSPHPLDGIRVRRAGGQQKHRGHCPPEKRAQVIRQRRWPGCRVSQWQITLGRCGRL
ncbi:transposase [Streptomyces sp. NPDC085944]|uniref:transposase n=1 Tax=Streptomyces sp. NPDC085944 TaxID=3154962 RepID=UPI003428D3D2